MMPLYPPRDGNFFSRPARIGTLWLLALALLIGELGAVTFPLRWRWSNPAPHGNNIADMAYSQGLGLGIQVCERGQIYTSDDLLFWLPQESGTTNALRAVTFFNTRIVVTGERGTVLYSDAGGAFRNGLLTNGVTGDWLEGVTVGAGQVVAVGDNGAIYTTSNGLNWRRQTVSFTDWLRGVTYGNAGFVAVGESGAVVTSTTGTTWTKRASPTTRHLNRFAHSNGRYTAVGDGGLILTSTNGGVSWTSLVPGATNDLLTIAESDNTRLASGADEVRLQAGSVWSNELAKSNGPPAWTYLSTISQSGFYLIGGRTGLMAESYRTNISSFYWVVDDVSIRHWQFEVSYAGGFYVSVGDRASVMTSVNGADWNLERAPDAVTNSTLLGVGGTTNLLVAVGEKGSLMISRNMETNVTVTNVVGTTVIVTNRTYNTLGVVWEAIEPRPTTNDLQGVCSFQGGYLVTGGNGAILTSPDGASWATGAAPANALLSGVAASASMIVAVGTRGTILSSPDAVTWTIRASGTTNWLYRVRHLNGRFVSVGQNGAILTSTNGVNWTTRTSGTTRWLNDVSFIDDTYFVIGVQGAVMTSTNTINWTDRGTITQKALYGAATDSRQLITVGVEGVILRSPVVPELTPVNFLQFSRTSTTISTPPRAENLYLFGGRIDQRFNLSHRRNAESGSWTNSAQLEFFDSSGTLFYLELFAGTNLPSREFYRTTLAP